MTQLPQTAIQTMLGCRYPIIQTVSMGWVATPGTGGWHQATPAWLLASWRPKPSRARRRGRAGWIEKVRSLTDEAAPA